MQIKHVCMHYLLEVAFPAPFGPGPLPSRRSVITTTGSTCCVLPWTKPVAKAYFPDFGKWSDTCLFTFLHNLLFPGRGCRKWAVKFGCFVPYLHMVHPHSQPWLFMTKIKFLYLNSTKLRLEKEPDWISPYICNLLTIRVGIAADLYQK